jgi:glycosyltransferase involved in cell wall biosynthesis
MLAGALIGGGWLYRLIETIIGIRNLADISKPEWDLDVLQRPSVLVVVPARNEEAKIEQCLRSLLSLDYSDYTICAVDDRSDDATGDIMDSLEREHPGKLRVLHVTELPPGWLGKTHAMWRGAAEHDSDWILFTDGDIIFRPDALRRAIAYAEASRSDHLVLFPTMLMKTFGERMMLSFLQLVFSLAHRPYKISDPKARDAIGVGAFNLIRRTVYDDLGSYRALRMEVLDDMMLGASVKAHGFTQRCAFGEGLVSLRWAEGAADVVRNLRKNMFSAVRFSWTLALLSVLAAVITQLGPWIGFIFAPDIAKLGFAVAIAVIAGMYYGMSARTKVPLLYFLTHPIATVIVIYTLLESARSSLVHGGVVWRGTTYSLEQIHAVTEESRREQELRIRALEGKFQQQQGPTME